MNADPTAPPINSGRPAFTDVSRSKRPALVATLITAVTILLLAPTLAWLEFSSGSENLVVATAMETRREGNWLVPTLMGESRVKKPPLVGWIAAASMSGDTLASLNSPDSPAFRLLAWQVRWPLLAVVALLALGTYRLAATVADPQVAWISVAMLLSSFIVMRFVRSTTTDTYLLLFVTLANACVAHALVRRNDSLKRQARSENFALLAAGMFTGLAMLTKGPVVVLQVVLPWVMWACVVWLRRNKVARTSAGAGDTDPSRNPRIDKSGVDDGSNASANIRIDPREAIPATLRGVNASTGQTFWIGFSIAIALVIGTSWFVAIYLRSPDVINVWTREVTRVGATDEAAGSPFLYLTIVGFVFPWTIFAIVGVIDAMRRAWRDPRDWLLPLLILLVLPLALMSLAPDRKERYMLPLAVPICILAAHGSRLWMKSLGHPKPIDQFIRLTLTVSALAIVVGVPALGVTQSRFLSDSRWFTPYEALIALLVLGLIFLWFIKSLVHRHTRDMILAPCALMLVAQLIVVAGYRHSREGISEMKILAREIDRLAPNASLFHIHPRRIPAPADLAIYADRIVAQIDSVAQARAAGGACVLLLKQAKREPEPRAPDGFVFLSKGRRDANVWWAFIRGEDQIDGISSSSGNVESRGPSGE